MIKIIDILNTKIKDIEKYINESIYKTCNHEDTSKKLKEDIINTVYMQLNHICKKYIHTTIYDKNNKLIVNENIVIGEYKSTANKFYIEIMIANENKTSIKYLSFDIYNPTIKKTNKKIGNNYIYEVTKNSFDFSNFYLSCSHYTSFYQNNNIFFKWDINKTIKENIELF